MKLAEDREIRLMLPEFVLEEAKVVLSRSFPGYEPLLEVFLSRLEYTILLWKDIEQSILLYQGKVRDRKDAPLLASVVVGKPDFAVTGDLGLREDMKRCDDAAGVTKICSSRELLEALSRKGITS